MSGLAAAALVAAAPVSAQTVAAAPQPQVEQVADDASLLGSNRFFGFISIAIIIAVLIIVAFEDDDDRVVSP
ncbi:MAG: hypothetical protein M3Q08_10405 [Pseudomonadota bacterium]|nr:hypothetical protein [Pseudomonadota bacterium]